MKMPKLVGMFIFISREIFMLTRKNLQLLVIWDLLAWKISCSACIELRAWKKVTAYDHYKGPNQYGFHCRLSSQLIFYIWLSCKSRQNSHPQWLNWMCIWLVIRRSWVWSLPGPAIFFRGNLSWNIFYGHSVTSAVSRRGVVSFCRPR